MKLLVEINNLSTCRIGEDFFIGTIQEALKASGYDFLRAKNISVSVALVRPEEIQKLFPDCYARGRAFGVMAVKSGGFEFEVATFRKDIGTADHRRPENIEYR